jgi:uncharacterized damage-inducible protein DinB
MYTSAGLLDIHERTHRSIQGVLDHCATLPKAELTRAGEGFSYPTLASQLHHVIGAERYWFGVLQEDIFLDDDEAAHQTIEALRAMRQTVAEATAAFISSCSGAELSATRTITKWNGETAEVVPAHVLLRTQTHAYQHQGEIASMLRQLGHTFPPLLDFPLV